MAVSAAAGSDAGAAQLPALAGVRRHWQVLLWPALAALLAAALWSFTLAQAGGELRGAEQAAVKDAGTFADAYAQYVTRSVAQMDQITMQLKHSWEQSHARLDLTELHSEGMFTDSAFVAVSIADNSGRVLSSTRPPRSGEVGAEDYFQFHKNNNSTALRISVEPESQRAIQGTVVFTRRLDGPDDSFAGVVVLTMDANYFTSFFSERTLGQDGMVALIGENGTLRLEQHGVRAASAEQVSLLLGQPEHAEAGGVRLAEAAEFSDGEARFVGWRKSAAYPLVAFVGLARHEAVAAADATRVAAIRNTAIVSLALLLLATWAAVVARRAQLRRHEEAEVRRAYRTATESANDGFYMASALHGEDGRIVDFEIVDCNERGAFFYGLARSDLVGMRLSELATGVFGEALFDTYLKAMATGFHEDDREMPADNRLNIRWGHRRLVRVGNGLAVTLQDVSERKAHEGDLLRMANEDTLTGLPNRYWLNNFLPDALERARAAGRSLALLFIDLDEFKHVNDTQGHAAGDQLLRQAAERLKSLLRPGDQVVRFGGDEFIVVLDPAESDAQVGSVAARILTAFAQPFTVADEQQAVGASIGVSVFPRDGQDHESLIKHGDIAMYAGKSEGKGQVRFFDPALYTRLKSRARLKHSLVQAIERDQLQLYYQPRVDTRTGELCSMEALVRWIHPELGMIPPLEFIPLAEASGLILRIGEVVMAKACAQLAAWRAQGLPLVPVSINVSPRQFAHGHIHRQLAVQLRRYRIEPALLEVEITESAMMGEQDAIIAELAAIRDLGVKLHVDDFGTGYSSLSQLQKLKMDVLKVDKSFTSELGNSHEGRVFFQAIVSMAHALGMSVVAEGVETAQQLRILQELACNEVQGYYVARPMPPHEMVALMGKRFLFPAAASAA